MIAAVVLMAAPALAQKSHRSEISVSYGIAPVTDWIDTYSNVFTGLFSGSDTDLKKWGAVTVGYNFRLIGSLSIGAQVVYSSNKQEVVRDGTQISNRYWSLMPNVKWSWLNLKVISLYSRLGAGTTFSKAKIDGKHDSSTQFAFQVSPIGIEVGRRITAYAEAGIGVSGCLLVGARYRF